MAKPKSSKALDTAAITEELRGMLPDNHEGLVDSWQPTIRIRRSELEVITSGQCPFGKLESAAALDLFYINTDPDPTYTTRWTMLLSFEAWVREYEARAKKRNLTGVDEFIAACWAVSAEKREYIQCV